MNKLYKHRFSDLYDISSGISSTSEQANHGSPFLSFKTVFNNYFVPDVLVDLMDTSKSEQETYSIKYGDVFLTRTSETVDALAMSCVAVKDYPRATYSGFLKRLRPKTADTVYAKYIAFFLRSKYFRKVIDSNTIMTLRASFNEDIFSFLNIYLPNYDEQVKIGDLLYSLEKKIQSNKRINDSLRNQLKILYNYWFCQFDFPDENGAPYKFSGGDMEYNTVLKQEIPAGWELESVADNSITSMINSGVEPFAKKFYLTTADISGTSISSGREIEYETRESRANMQPRENSVWFARMANSIKHLYLNREMGQLIENTILSTGFCGLQCDEHSFEYMASFLEYSYFEKIKNYRAYGATQEAVNNDDLRNIVLIIPTNKVLKRYHEQTQCLYAQISKNICENQALEAFRDWILPMFINGQASVAD